MPSPYSEDFRQKAITAVERGEGKTKVARMMNMSRNTLDLWLARKQEVGNCRAITHYHQQGCRHKITDWARFRAFAKEHGEKTQAQMAKLWGDNVSQQNISDALQKLDIVEKKDLWVSRAR
jgi:transposase